AVQRVHDGGGRGVLRDAGGQKGGTGAAHGAAHGAAPWAAPVPPFCPHLSWCVLRAYLPPEVVSCCTAPIAVARMTMAPASAWTVASRWHLPPTRSSPPSGLPLRSRP